MSRACVSRASLLLAGALVSAPALASTPAAGAPADAPRERPREDPAVQRRIDEMNRACASNPMSRVVMPKPRCPKLMEAVIKLGDGAVPALAQRILDRALRVAEFAQARQRQGEAGAPGLPMPLLMDDSPSIMTSVLGRIGTPAAQEALVGILAHPAVQRHDAWTCYAVHSALREGPPASPALGDAKLCQSPAGRAELLQAARALGQRSAAPAEAAKNPGAI